MARPWFVVVVLSASDLAGNNETFSRDKRCLFMYVCMLNLMCKFCDKNKTTIQRPKKLQIASSNHRLVSCGRRHSDLLQINESLFGPQLSQSLFEPRLQLDSYLARLPSSYYLADCLN